MVLILQNTKVRQKSINVCYDIRSLAALPGPIGFRGMK